MKNGVNPEGSLDHLSIQQLGQLFGKTMSGNDPAKLLLKGEGKGTFLLEMDSYPSILIYKTNFNPGSQLLQMPLYREEDTLTLIFQEEGFSSFGSRENPSLLMSSNRHSLQFFHGMDCNLNIGKGKENQSLSIKLKQDYFKEYVIENQHIGGWFYEKMERNDFMSGAATALTISPEIRIILHQIRNCPYAATFKRLYIDGMIKVLLTYQLDAYNQLFLNKTPVWQDQKINARDVGKLHEIKEYISQNYLDTLSLFNLSRCFALNEFKLKYGFKKLFGISVMQCIYDMRLNYSKQLLLETGESIFEIAQRIGYEHPNNFSACFKRKFGYSPTVYRNKIATLQGMGGVPDLIKSCT